MKNVLLATTILGLTAGMASAEITLSGDARMGLLDDFGATDVVFSSRARVKFTMSGESDSGFSFGAEFRANDAVGAASGTAGSVFISGAFGKLSMGDVDGAVNAAVGQVSGVGYTGLGDRNEIRYLGNGGSNYGFASTNDPSALYEYSAGGFTAYLSATNPSGSGDAIGVGAKYTAGNFTFAIGHEQLDLNAFTWKHTAIGASAALGAVTLKAVYGHTTEDAPLEYDQYAVSADYVTGALTLTAFVSDTEDFAGTIHPDSASSGQHYGLGASYDLGGGASVGAGYVKDQTDDVSAFDVGLKFSF